MNLFYRIGNALFSLKHWQVFLLITVAFSLNISLDRYVFHTQEEGSLSNAPTWVLMGWIINSALWAVFNALVYFSVGLTLIRMANRRLGREYISPMRFMGSYLLAMAGFLAFGVYMQFNKESFRDPDEVNIGAAVLMFFGMFAAMFLMLFTFSRVAKAFQTAQTNRPATFSSYFGVFVEFIFFFPFTLWYLQPMLNRLVEEEQETLRPA